MKKAGILALTLILIAAMFSGCRRQHPSTTSSSSTKTTTSTNSTTGTTGKPQSTTRVTTPPSSGILPDMTDGTSGTDMSRGRTVPRY